MTSITWSLRDYKTVKTGFLEWLMIQGVINSISNITKIKGMYNEIIISSVRHSV